MGEKTKNAIMDVLKSDDMRAYFEEILRNQTSEIVSSFRALEETRMSKELQALKTKLLVSRNRVKNLF